MSTPVQRQYWELKKQNPSAILFFQLGDFYEMFHEDAQIASRVLGITLTARHKGTENEMPMCGFPHHSASGYIETLIENNYSVAIAEQVVDPETKKIHREIVRVVTPGTSIETGNLAPEENSFLAAITNDKKYWAIAYTDLSTGDFRTAVFENEISFLDELWKINPREILLSSKLFADEKRCLKLPKSHLTPRKPVEKSDIILAEHFQTQNLEILGLEKIETLFIASAMVLDYLKETQKTKLNHIHKLVRYTPQGTMGLDQQTMRHLEVFESIMPGEKDATLFSVFERPFTAMGGRTLRYWVANPLLNIEKILYRSDGVEELFQSPEAQNALKIIFENICDIPRVLTRISVNRGNARDLVFLRNSFSVFPKLIEVLDQLHTPIFREQIKLFEGFQPLVEKLQAALIDAPPLEITQGGMFRSEYSTELEKLRKLKQNADEWLDNFLEKKRAESGIQKLRIKHSNNFGFCLEVSKAQIDNVPESWMRKQTLVNAERFTTPELAEYEDKVLNAETQAFELEHKLFQDLQNEVLTHMEKIQNAAEKIGILDAILSLAQTAQQYRWNRPDISEKQNNFEIKNGRHPVVEKIANTPFIANDLQMGNDSLFWLITGPNMAGKSTYLRQNALIILLAQMGSFVPAEICTMPVFDRIFTRVGASDNLAGGQSTFFVEMSETARILNAATDKSFVILDEIGRGTSTFDGISLAWAITEFLHDKIGARTIFATHYHELIDCVENLKSGKNYHVSVTNDEDQMIFLRKIKPGGISDSFGIEVAAMCGFPKEVLIKSKEILHRLENENLAPAQPSLFNIPQASAQEMQKELSVIEEKLKDLDPNELSPKGALDLLFELKKLQGK